MTQVKLFYPNLQKGVIDISVKQIIQVEEGAWCHHKFKPVKIHLLHKCDYDYLVQIILTTIHILANTVLVHAFRNAIH